MTAIIYYGGAKSLGGLFTAMVMKHTKKINGHPEMVVQHIDTRNNHQAPPILQLVNPRVIPSNTLEPVYPEAWATPRPPPSITPRPTPSNQGFAQYNQSASEILKNLKGSIYQPTSNPGFGMGSSSLQNRFGNSNVTQEAPLLFGSQTNTKDKKIWGLRDTNNKTRGGSKGTRRIKRITRKRSRSNQNKKTKRIRF